MATSISIGIVLAPCRLQNLTEVTREAIGRGRANVRRALPAANRSSSAARRRRSSPHLVATPSSARTPALGGRPPTPALFRHIEKVSVIRVSMPRDGGGRRDYRCGGVRYLSGVVA